MKQNINQTLLDSLFMGAKERFAFKCSLAVLLHAESSLDVEPCEHSIMTFPHLPLSGELYLWTFTTPDPVGLGELAVRWADFLHRWKQRRPLLPALRLLRVFEPHQRHGYHVHFVAARRYDVRMMRTLATKSNFGRINVLKMPAQKALYAAKYLQKHKRKPGEKAVRMWASVGFRGCPVNSVRITDSWVTEIISYTVGYADFSKNAWSLLWLQAMERRIRISRINGCDPKNKKMAKLNDKQATKVSDLLNLGKGVRFLEYRSTVVRSTKKWVDGRASLTEKSFFAQHNCETAAGVPLLIEEPLPDTYVEGSPIAVPLKKGESFIFEEEKAREYKGVVTYQGILHANV